MEEKIIEKTAEAVMNNEAVEKVAEQAIKAKPKLNKGGLIGFAAGMVVTIAGSLIVVHKINKKTEDGEGKEKKVLKFRQKKNKKEVDTEDGVVEDEEFDDEE